MTWTQRPPSLTTGALPPSRVTLVTKVLGRPMSTPCRKRTDSDSDEQGGGSGHGRWLASYRAVAAFHSEQAVWIRARWSSIHQVAKALPSLWPASTSLG